jgi:hypothetical protein
MEKIFEATDPITIQLTPDVSVTIPAIAVYYLATRLMGFLDSTKLVPGIPVPGNENPLPRLISTVNESEE